MKQKKKGGFTFKSTGVLFILSSVFELAFVTGETPLFGAIRGGAVAVAYHLMYVVLFAAVGIGLLKAKPWGFKLVMVATVLNTADRLQLIADRATLDGYVTMIFCHGFNPDFLLECRLFISNFRSPLSPRFSEANFNTVNREKYPLTKCGFQFI